MRALISVSDKTGIVECAKRIEKCGIEIISTGGTYRLLEKEGVAVTPVEEITGFPECLDGRVKTLHPKIHGGILAVRNKAEHRKTLEELDIQPIDLLIVNLYPFEQTVTKEGVTLEEAIENIDIGGPTMIRAAAKNYGDVAVVTDPEDYDKICSDLEAGKFPDEEGRFGYALKVFHHTASYDALIAEYMLKQKKEKPFLKTYTKTYKQTQALRYGENPHQEAVFYEEILRPKGTLADAVQIHGKELSFNNINDTNGALELLKEYYKATTVVAVKHGNPCGVGTAENIHDAYVKAYEGDPVSIFGGIVAANKPIDGKTAQKISEIFIEVVVAPDFDQDAIRILTQKKNIRLLKIDGIDQPYQGVDQKKVMGGMLLQETDDLLLKEELKVVTKRKPTAKEMKDLMFAWKIVKHTKSNAISIAKEEKLVANGPGQVSRIWALENAIRQGGDEVIGSVLASDAFFPFADSVQAANEAGITAIIQPGGSVKDEDSIRYCDEHDIAMVFTGIRHFKH